MRYTGPRGKKVRRLAKAFTEKESRILEKRQSLPGQHGQSRSKLSEYALQMREKQRTKYAYGLTEKQFYKTYLEAQRETGQTGDNLLKLLERRLDNVVYRLGFASTRSQARQMVGHGFLEINGRRANIASRLVHPGDMVVIREGKRNTALISRLKDQLQAANTPDWLSLDPTKLQGNVLSNPASDQAESVEVRLIVEHYKRI